MTDDENTEGDASQDDIDSMFEDNAASADAAAGESTMALNEIEEDASLKETDTNPYDVGEPMAGNVSAIYEIPVQISAVLGRSTMQVSQLLKLGRGAVVELDRKVGEAIDIYVNNRLVARGEVVVVEDKLGVTMTEIVKSDKG